MKKLTRVLLFSIILCMSMSTCVCAKPLREGVLWLSYDGETFRKENKITSPLLIFVGAQHCDDCLNMFKKTLRDPKIKQFIDSHFIAMFTKKGEPAVLKKYEVTVYPTLLVLNNKGDVIEKLVGFHDSDETMKVLVGASLKAGTV